MRHSHLGNFGARIGMSVPMVGDAGTTIIRDRGRHKLKIVLLDWPMRYNTLGTESGVVRAMTHCAGRGTCVKKRGL